MKETMIVIPVENTEKFNKMCSQLRQCKLIAKKGGEKENVLFRVALSVHQQQEHTHQPETVVRALAKNGSEKR